jgi:hypothetical protein
MVSVLFMLEFLMWPTPALHHPVIDQGTLLGQLALREEGRCSIAHLRPVHVLKQREKDDYQIMSS